MSKKISLFIIFYSVLGVQKIITAIFKNSIDLFPEMSYNYQRYGAFSMIRIRALIKADAIIVHIYADIVSLLFVTHFTGGIS